jgi:hypothetical protein
MAKRYPRKAREVAVALYLKDLSVPEITRRLNDGTAGLIDKEGRPQPIGITGRRVAEYVAEHKTQHGPRPEPEDQELTINSINRVKQRALNVLAREIAHLEELPKGRISAKQSTALRQHYATLDDMERRQEIAEKRKGRGKRRSAKAPASDKPESAIEALAKAESGGKHAGARENGSPEPKQEAEQAELAAGRQDGHFEPAEMPETQPPSRETHVDNGHNGGHSRGLSNEELDEIMGSARP